MKKSASYFVSAIAFLMPIAAFAQTQACLIDGTFTIMGRTIPSKDCVQVPTSVPIEQFQHMCQGLADTSAQLGGKAGNVTYMATCPKQPQGICKGAMGGMDIYYYARSPDDLAKLPKSCEAGAGGRWDSGR